MPKVLHVLNEIRASGLERMLECSANQWRESDYDLTILGMGKSHPFAVNLTSVGYSVNTIPDLKSLNGVSQYIKFLRNNNFDIIHIHAESMHGFSSLIAKSLLPKTPIFRTIHNCFRAKGTKKFIRKIQNFIQNRSCSEVISVSSDVQENEKEQWGIQTLVIENWIDIEKILFKNLEFDRIQHKLPVVAFLGNCSAVKDHEYALSVILDYQDIRVIHMGHPHASTNDEIMILKKLEDQGRLIWNSPTEHVIKNLLGADVHILSSKNEGMSLALMESIGVGMQSWVRESDGTRWAQEIESVKFFNSKSSLAYLLEELIMEKKLHPDKFIFQPNTKLLERFNPERGVKEYVSLYQSFEN